ncbi:MAG TPA: tetratricopeptide repeat protein, partial [Chthoniobacterales bacterium]|nr:tetratricopeptide repeat protein [Chthoniobacterales bacterium]
KKAVETLKQLDATYPRVPPIKFQYARALFQAGDFAQCAAMLEQAIGLAPGFNEAHLMLAEVNLRLGNVPAVITAMEEFLKKNPNNTRAEIFLADGYRAAGRFDDAVAILRKQVAAAPNNAEPHLLLGVLLRQQNKPVEAREAFEKAAQLAPANMNALDQLIDLDILAGDPATAYRRVTERLEKTPDSAALHLLEGKIAVAQRDWDRAEAALLRVMHLNANIPRAYELLATTYVGANKLEQAVPQIEAFLAKAPENVGALMTLGILQTELKQYEKARDTYEKLLSIRPDIVPAMNNLAYIYSDHLNQLQKAQEWASKAHSAEPENGAITDTFGWILYRQGDYKGAATLLREAAEKLPNEPEVQHHLGMASYMMGDATAARAAFEAALSSPRDFPGKDEAKRRLDLLAGGGASTEGMTAEELEGLLKQQPNDPLTMVKLADAYEKQGATAKAAGLYEQAIKINPTLAVATLKLAQLYAGPLQKKDRALELAKKARDLAPGDAKSTALVGRLAFDAGNYSWAYSLLQDSARQLGSDPVVLKDLAWAAYSIGKVNEARQTMERVAQNAPGSAEAADAKRFLALTVPQRLEGDPAEGLEDATAALKDDPKYVPALMLRARAEAAKGGKDQAIKTYADVLARFPEFAPAQKQLAALYLEDPNSRMKAFDLASTARKAMPDDPELAAILGQASYFKRDYSRAAQLLQESNRKKPLEPKPLCYLGLSLAELKQSAAATDTLRQAMNKGLPEPLASDAGKVLQQLESK